MAPDAIAYIPAPQLEQLLAAMAPVALEKEPAVQSWHDEAPGAELYVPAGQEVQELSHNVSVPVQDSSGSLLLSAQASWMSALN